MPFPPAFTNAWDNTFPPDTQAANLLGQDLRNLRTDVQQRHALLSGTLANQPTNMDTTFGGVGYGALYFATDTGQIFQWSGAVWVDITSSFTGGRISSGIPVNTNGIGQNGIVLAAIPAAALQVGTVIDIDGQLKNPLSSGIQVLFGASILATLSGDANSVWLNFSIKLIVTGASAETISGMGVLEDLNGITITNTPILFAGTAVEAIAGAIVVKTAQSSIGTVTHNFLSVRWR